MATPKLIHIQLVMQYFEKTPLLTDAGVSCTMTAATAVLAAGRHSLRHYRHGHHRHHQGAQLTPVPFVVV
jgi:hypothetical protein